MRELIDFGVLVIIYFLKFYKKWKVKGKDVLFINTVMYIYLAFVLYFTLMPIVTAIPSIFNDIVFNQHYKSMNLVPFVDVLYKRGDFTRQIVLNIIMMFPFGFLLPFVKKEVKLVKVTLYTFFLSFSIEVLQMFFTNGVRASDITDIITNIIGGVIGYVIYLIFRPFITKVLKYIKNGIPN